MGLGLGGGSSSTYPYIHITINTLQVELKNPWGATDKLGLGFGLGLGLGVDLVDVHDLADHALNGGVLGQG